MQLEMVTFWIQATKELICTSVLWLLVSLLLVQLLRPLCTDSPSHPAAAVPCKGVVRAARGMHGLHWGCVIGTGQLFPLALETANSHFAKISSSSGR